ncbi:MAG: aromatic acid decarboxylase, partial [Aquificae bacterium]|nr:aromatic acid decarboxylase [Aquificota bacterium]
MQKKLLLCVTGASGSLYALRFAEHALRLGLGLECVVSETGKKVLAHEL